MFYNFLRNHLIIKGFKLWQIYNLFLIGLNKTNNFISFIKTSILEAVFFSFIKNNSYCVD